jgi:hypothetical protein
MYLISCSNTIKKKKLLIEFSLFCGNKSTINDTIYGIHSVPLTFLPIVSPAGAIDFYI